MNMPVNTNLDDYEVLIRRRGESDYASYCPQLTYMIKGATHEEVEEAMKTYVRDYVESLQVNPLSQP